jgi:hypothetical protein
MLPRAIKIFKLQQDSYNRHNDLLRESGKTDSRLQPSYHVITSGLRKEHKIKDLATFMMLYGQFADDADN